MQPKLILAGNIQVMSHTQESDFISFPICYFNTEISHLERKLHSLQYLKNTKR